MMRQVILWAVLVLFGAAAGFGGAWFTTKSKIDSREVIITDMKSKLQKSQADAQAAIKASQEKVLRMDVELARSKDELKRVKTDLIVAKSALEEFQRREAEAAKQMLTAREEVKPTETAAVDNSMANVPTVEYTVKANDSFWTIAQSQLGNGSRYNEIIKLNPDAANRKYLAEGMKLRLPAK